MTLAMHSPLLQSLLLALILLETCLAQQIYLDVPLIQSRPQCSRTKHSTPSYGFSSFSFSQNTTRRTAKSLAVPTAAITYAAPYSVLSRFVPSLSTTSWGNWNISGPPATDTANPYGHHAWTSQWLRASLATDLASASSRFSTTVQPTPVPTSELVFPDANPFGPQDCLTFPPDFMFGVSGAAAQIEGAIAQEGRAPAFADKFIGPEFVLEIFGRNRSRDFVANENYFYYKQDIERLAAIGAEYYSFSIPWSRILPFTFPGTPVNSQALEHYSDLIDFAISRGIKPVITMLHIDTPLAFYPNVSDTGRDPLFGFIDYAAGHPGFEDAFVNYGKILMSHFADRVPVWITYNEPITGVDKGNSVYVVLKSHARLWHFYHEDIKGTGKVSLKFNNNFGVPLDPRNATDVAAAKQFNDMTVGVLANPLFLGKDYPETFKQALPDYVRLSAADLAYMNGTADFFAMDAYTATVVTALPNATDTCILSNGTSPFWPQCVISGETNKNGWQIGYASYTYVYITPGYLRTYINWAWNTYRKPIVVSEYGYTVFDEANKPFVQQQYDSPRGVYYQSFLQAMLEAIWEDHCQVIGAWAWTFADNWEWGDYKSQYGLQTVNRTSQERHYKKSFFDMVDYYIQRKSI